MYTIVPWIRHGCWMIFRMAGHLKITLNNMWPDMPTAINIRHHIYNSFLMRTYPWVPLCMCTCRCMQNKHGKRNSNKSFSCKISVHVRYVYEHMHYTFQALKNWQSQESFTFNTKQLNNPSVKGLKTQGHVHWINTLTIWDDINHL